MNLERFGWTDALAASCEEQMKQGFVPGRIIRVERGLFRVAMEQGECDAVISGSLRHHTADSCDFIVTGDWVLLDSVDRGTRAIVETVPRLNVITRKEPGRSSQEQPIVANIDRLFLLFPVTDSFNIRRVERYVALARDAGVASVVVLTKADLFTDVSLPVSLAETVSDGYHVVAVSSKTGEGLDRLRQFLERGRTIALLGPSGAGKSSLVNALSGELRAEEGEVRISDGRGRHTTTRREIFMLPCGALIIDNPGMRELALVSDAETVGSGFDEILALSRFCRFKDCSHESEPGCAVLKAVETGSLDQGRLDGYRKLVREARHFEGRTDARIREEEKRRSKQIAKSIRELNRRKD